MGEYSTLFLDSNMGEYSTLFLDSIQIWFLGSNMREYNTLFLNSNLVFRFKSWISRKRIPFPLSLELLSLDLDFKCKGMK